MKLTDKQLYLKRNKERPWYKHWKAVRQRCNDKNANNYKYYGGRGIKCYLTTEDIKFLWFRDKAYLMKEAHLSRKNHNKNYILNNCFFSNKNQNVGESNKRNKSIPILQFDKQGEFIKEWESITLASKENLGEISNISKCAKRINGYKSVKGFIWRFKNG
jgi:hypothetical protein